MGRRGLCMCMLHGGVECASVLFVVAVCVLHIPPLSRASPYSCMLAHTDQGGGGVGAAAGGGPHAGRGHAAPDAGQGT